MNHNWGIENHWATLAIAYSSSKRDIVKSAPSQIPCAHIFSKALSYSFTSDSRKRVWGEKER